MCVCVEGGGRPHQAQEVLRDDQESGVQAIAKDNRYHGGCSVAVISSSSSSVGGYGLLKKSINRKIRGRLSYMHHEKYFSERYSVLRLTTIEFGKYEILRS